MALGQIPSCAGGLKGSDDSGGPFFNSNLGVFVSPSLRVTAAESNSKTPRLKGGEGLHSVAHRFQVRSGPIGQDLECAPSALRKPRLWRRILTRSGRSTGIVKRMHYPLDSCPGPIYAGDIYV